MIMCGSPFLLHHAYTVCEIYCASAKNEVDKFINFELKAKFCGVKSGRKMVSRYTYTRFNDFAQQYIMTTLHQFLCAQARRVTSQGLYLSPHQSVVTGLLMVSA